MMMIEIVHRHIIPAAYAVLPPAMTSGEATAELLAIGLQESGFTHRRQVDGPARSLWQFERAGVVGVITHRRTQRHLRNALVALRYPPAPAKADAIWLHRVIEHNDVLACVLARLLLWTLPERLPGRTDRDRGWAQYLAAWRPGAVKRDPLAHRTRWDRHYEEGWLRVEIVALEGGHGIATENVGPGAAPIRPAGAGDRDRGLRDRDSPEGPAEGGAGADRGAGGPPGADRGTSDPGDGGEGPA